VVDDDEAVRRSLGRLLRAHGFMVAEHASAEGFLNTIGTPPPEACCALLDIRMPGMDGLTLQHLLAERRLALPVIVVTGHADVPLAVEAMRAGALDVVEKPYAPERLLEAIHSALARSRESRERERLRLAFAARLRNLSPRERDVLDLLVEGLPNKLIAHRLGLSIRTVEGYRATMMEKLSANSLSEAVRIAILANEHIAEA
jgi:two-component system response regulator FixJ